MNYYNEIEPYCIKWIKNLISEKLIPPGDIDERSIKDVRANDLKEYTQCHFFAGICGWPLALQLAQWPANRPVWTGSCPCQPFSVAGKRKGQADKRHLWPVWFDLIAELRPTTIFGEQVASAITAGWWDEVANDLEREDYAVGAAVLPACSIGAPHRRDRLFFVADSTRKKDRGIQQPEFSPHTRAVSKESLSYSNGIRPQGWQESVGISAPQPETRGCNSSDREHAGWHAESRICKLANGVSARVGKLRALGNAIVPGVAAEFIKAFMDE